MKTKQTLGTLALSAVVGFGIHAFHVDANASGLAGGAPQEGSVSQGHSGQTLKARQAPKAKRRNGGPTASGNAAYWIVDNGGALASVPVDGKVRMAVCASSPGNFIGYRLSFSGGTHQGEFQPVDATHMTNPGSPQMGLSKAIELPSPPSNAVSLEMEIHSNAFEASCEVGQPSCAAKIEGPDCKIYSI